MTDLPWIRDLIAAVRDAPIAVLEIEHDGWRVAIRRGVATGPAAAPPPASPPPAAAIMRTDAPADADDAAAEHVVTTPDHGVFHRAAAPGGAPFVTEGDTVEAGQQLGVIEAMKVFSPIFAPVAGRVAAICAADGAEVEAGAHLFRLQ